MILKESEFNKLQHNKAIVFIVKKDRVFTNYQNDDVMILQQTTLLCEDGRKCKGSVFFSKFSIDLLKQVVQENRVVNFNF